MKELMTASRLAFKYFLKLLYKPTVNKDDLLTYLLTVSPYMERHLIEQLLGAHGEILHGFLNFEFCTTELFKNHGDIISM